MPLIDEILDLAGYRREDLYVCLGCKICSSICVLNEIGIEANPRNFIINLIMEKEELEGDPLLKYCTGCYACTFFCPWEIKVPDVVRAARAAFLPSHPFERAFSSSLELFGRVYEPYLLFRLLPYFFRKGYLRLLVKGLPSFRPSLPKKVKIEGVFDKEKK